MVCIKASRRTKVLILGVVAIIGFFTQSSFYPRKVYGDLTINNTFSYYNKVYELRINRTHIASVSQIDSWYIDYPYLYGTIYQDINGGEDMSYMIYNCKNNEYVIYNNGDEFEKLLDTLGFGWKNFMSGENPIRVFYNMRYFSKDCKAI